MEIRKFVTVCEDTLSDAGRPTGRVVRKAVCSAVITNPFAGQWVDDLDLLEQMGAEISGQLAERALLAGEDRRSLVTNLQPSCRPDDLRDAQTRVRAVHASAALIEYVQAIAAFTRATPDWHSGLSPRAALGLLAAARAWAWLEGRDHVLPEDVQIVLPGIVGHRLRAVDDSREVGAGETAATRIIESVPLP